MSLEQANMFTVNRKTIYSSLSKQLNNEIVDQQFAPTSSVPHVSDSIHPYSMLAQVHS